MGLLKTKSTLPDNCQAMEEAQAPLGQGLISFIQPELKSQTKLESFEWCLLQTKEGVWPLVENAMF